MKYILLVAVLGGCMRPTPEEAEAAYLEEQLACVRVSHTLQQSIECRCEVDKRWHVEMRSDSACKR